MKRGNGDGSIIKLSGKRRKPYAVRVTIGWSVDGKQKYKYIGYYSSKTEAKKELNKYLAEPTKIKLEKHLLKSVFNNMIETSKFSEGTVKQYISGFKQLEHLHNTNIEDIELWQLEELVKDKPSSTQGRIKKTLSNCYKYAIKHDYVDKNLADYIGVDASTTKKELIPFTKDEIQTLWSDLGTKKHDDVPLILLYTGLRITELLEVTTDNVDIDKGTIYIAKSKTPSGVRTVPIHHKILPLITKRYDEGNKYLISNLSGNRIPYSTFSREHWHYEHTRHETRHTFITELTKRTNDMLAVKKIVGHATSDITDRYTHRTIEELSEIINKLEY